MKKLAIRSLGWGVGAMALLQIPVQASNSALNTTYSASELMSRNQVINAQISDAPSFRQPRLVAAAGALLNTRNLRPGDSGQDVRILQRFLNVIGYYPFPVDGDYGPNTADSVARYQAVVDLRRTGIADEETLQRMGFNFEPEAIPNAVAARPTNQQPTLFEDYVGPDSAGSDVIALQQRLSGFGFPLSVDGIYGFETERAVRNYQNARGFRPTGIADRETLDAMGLTARSFNIQGCSVPENPYIAAVIVDKSELDYQEDILQELFSSTNVCQDRNRQGTYINIGNFAERLPAEARVDAAAARGFRTRVIYRRTGLFR